MHIVKSLSATALAIAVSGCATVIRGTQQDFRIESDPVGATANLTTGQSCTTPCDLRLPRKQSFDVHFSMEGYHSGSARVNSGWSRGGTQTFVIGNLILGGLVGMGVDASNGATRDLTPNPLVVTMIPLTETPPAAAPEATASLEGAPTEEAPATAPAQ